MSDVIAKRRIFSEARRKLKSIKAAVDRVQLVSRVEREEEEEAAAKTAKAKRNWDLLKEATKAIVACSKETISARRAVTLMMDNMREHTTTLEERKFEVNKLQVVCEALNKMPDPEGDQDDPPARARSEQRRSIIMEVTEAAAGLEANSLVESIPDVEVMMVKLHQLQEEFQTMEVEGTAVTAMEEALDGVRVILDIAKAELDATPTQKAKLEAKRQATWKHLVHDVEVIRAPETPAAAADAAAAAAAAAAAELRGSSTQGAVEAVEQVASPHSQSDAPMKRMLQVSEDFWQDEEKDYEPSAAPGSASTSCPSTTPPWSAPSSTEARSSWSAPGTATGSLSEWIDALPDVTLPSSPRNALSRGPLPPLPETPLGDDASATASAASGAASPPPLVPALRRPRRRRLAPQRRLERRSIAALHMRRAGGRSLEGVVSWRERHGFRDGDAGDAALPRLALSELWSKAEKLMQTELQKPCICVVCLSGPGSLTPAQKSQASHQSVRYRCAFQRWKSWRLLHGHSDT
eukprot:s2820_g4.t1